VGTPFQWLSVFVDALFYFLVMLCLQVREKKADREPVVPSLIFRQPQKDNPNEPLLSIHQAIPEFLIAWMGAMFSEFGLKSITWPLVGIPVGPLLAFAAVESVLTRHNRDAVSSLQS
jgi:hypothetical protein